MKKTALILGATSDIAQQLAYEFANNTFDLILTSRQPDMLVPLAKDIENITSVKVEVDSFDALNTDSHDAFSAKYKDVDTVIVAFGYLGEQATAESSWEECQQILHTNFTGAVSILNRFANYFEERKAGSIIGISSVAGDKGKKSNYLYGSAKAGLSVYLQGLRNRLYHSGVHVLTVKPGFVHTKMTQGMDLPELLTASPTQIARSIFNAYRKKANTLYSLPQWRMIMLIINAIPETVFKRLNM
ncbi:SDR family oxidoreductase [Limibacter armeniacum]|uniref:SDR family oxidoreductase n=1 Tax=Limibacter armeniacum TaxID=466084 RepID=UPI002FE673D4